MVVTWTSNAGKMRLVAGAVVFLVLFLLTASTFGQRRGAFHAARPPMRSYGIAQNRAERPPNRGGRPQQYQRSNRGQQYQRSNRGQQRSGNQNQRAQDYQRWYQQEQRSHWKGRQAQSNQSRPQGNAVQRRAPGYSGAGSRPPYPRGTASNAPARGTTRPPYIANPSSGHLGDWLNQHGNLPFKQQEQLLSRDPSFKRLPRADQQRLIQQLHQVDQMPPAERERRLARNEAIERLSPQARAGLYRSESQWNSLPQARRALLKQAFRDLRAVPPGQRQTVLNSERYRNAFTPEERGILSNFLSVEPYQPQH